MHLPSELLYKMFALWSAPTRPHPFTLWIDRMLLSKAVQTTKVHQWSKQSDSKSHSFTTSSVGGHWRGQRSQEGAAERGPGQLDLTTDQLGLRKPLPGWILGGSSSLLSRMSLLFRLPRNFLDVISSYLQGKGLAVRWVAAGLTSYEDVHPLLSV